LFKVIIDKNKLMHIQSHDFTSGALINHIEMVLISILKTSVLRREN